MSRSTYLLGCLALVGFAALGACHQPAAQSSPMLGVSPVPSVSPVLGASPVTSAITEDPTSMSTAERPLRYVFTTTKAQIYTARSSKSRALGITLSGARLPVFEEVAAPKEAKSGCTGPWLRIQYNGWVCSDNKEPSIGGEESELNFENRYPTQNGTIFWDTLSYARPGGEAVDMVLSGTKVQVTRVFTLGDFTYAQLAPEVFVAAEDIIYTGRSDIESRLRGIHFDETTRPPFVIFVAKETPLFSDPGITDAKQAIGHQLRYENAALLEETSVKGERFLRVAGGWFAEQGVAIIKEEKRPKGVPADNRWVLVDLSEQTLRAFEGDHLTFATLVSSGRPRHRTAKGEFRLQGKYRYDTMEGGYGREKYKVINVPWAQYFYKGYALHGTFWHDKFGRVASHGCVNLSAADAKFLSEYLDPQLPPGWLAIYPTMKMETSRVIVRQ